MAAVESSYNDYPDEKIASHPKSEALRSLKAAFTTPGNALFGAGLYRLQRAFRGILSEAEIRDFLAHMSSYTRFRFRKQKFPRNSFILHHLYYSVQMDLFYVGRLAAENDGVHWILGIILPWSRYVWFIPLKDKSGPTVAAALDKYFSSLPTIPRFAITDKGNVCCYV